MNKKQRKSMNPKGNSMRRLIKLIQTAQDKKRENINYQYDE